MPEKTMRVEFPGAQGQTLAARFEVPAEQPRAHVLFAHCFTCSKDIPAVSRISRVLRGAGFAVLRFDFTGLGNSEGDFENTNFSSNLADLVAAADYMREHLAAPSLMVGHSLGGTASLVAAARVPECRAVATIGSPFDPAHVRRLMRDDTTVEIAGRTFRMDPSFLPDLERQDVATDISKLDRALLVIHAPLDEVVGYDHAAGIFSAAKHPKSFLAVDGANHMLDRKEDAEWVAKVIASWAPRYTATTDGTTSPSSPS